LINTEEHFDEIAMVLERRPYDSFCYNFVKKFGLRLSSENPTFKMAINWSRGTESLPGKLVLENGQWTEWILKNGQWVIVQ
jgi:hypothetical protein